MLSVTHPSVGKKGDNCCSTQFYSMHRVCTGVLLIDVMLPVFAFYCKKMTIPVLKPLKIPLRYMSYICLYVLLKPLLTSILLMF